MVNKNLCRQVAEQAAKTVVRFSGVLTAGGDLEAK